jgi:hypothetical protein
MKKGIYCFKAGVDDPNPNYLITIVAIWKDKFN